MDQYVFNEDGDILIERVERVAEDAPDFAKDAWRKAKQDRIREFKKKQDLSYDEKLERQAKIAWSYYEQLQGMDMSKRAEILHEAESCICGQREQDYGSPEDNFGTIAKLWTEYTGTLITALDVAMMMCLLKIARIKNGGGSGDSFVDIAGYAACGGEIHEHTT